MEKVRALLYGIIWLLIFNPFFVFVWSHVFFEENSWTTIILMGTSIFYYKFVWMNVRLKLIHIDKKFCDLYFGRGW